MTILNLPFKWFTIEQAISEINNHLGYTLSKNDILHLAQNYNLALCVDVREINDSFIDLYDQVTEIESYIMLEIEEREIYLSLLDEFTEEETLFFDLGNCQLQLFELRRNDLDDYRFLIADSYNFSGLLEIKKDEINYCGDILEVRADSLRDIEITYQEKKITGFISFLETEKDIEIPIDKAVITKESLLQFISENKKEIISEPTEKELSPKSETAYLNIIGALLETALKSGQFKNQAELIAHLEQHYQGYAGLSESNLKMKFAAANKSLSLV